MYCNIAMNDRNTIIIILIANAESICTSFLMLKDELNSKEKKPFMCHPGKGKYNMLLKCYLTLYNVNVNSFPV